MSILALDLGGTKLSIAIINDRGAIISKRSDLLDGRKGDEVGDLIINAVLEIKNSMQTFSAIGVSVPGIANQHTGKVWAPNIPGWDDYPLQKRLSEAAGKSVTMDNDRACSILGECWQGNAKNCRDAIFLSVGTGIGVGILSSGSIIRGAHDIAGAIGWMALHRPYESKYKTVGCFEYYASGDGVARLTQEILLKEKNYSGVLNVSSELNAHKVFSAFNDGDAIAKQVVKECVGYWGMATANLVSLFNPEKIIFGGGVFGPAIQFISQIKEEARLWAQPISINQVSFEPSALGNDAALYGAAFLASQHQPRLPHD